MPDDRYTISLWVDPDTGYLWFGLDAGGQELATLATPHVPTSSITPQARAALVHADCLSSSDSDFTEDLIIHGALIAGAPGPRIPVEVSDDPATLGVDCILGFDFFARFSEVNFVFPPHRLILIDP